MSPILALSMVAIAFAPSSIKAEKEIFTGRQKTENLNVVLDPLKEKTHQTFGFEWIVLVILG